MNANARHLFNGFANKLNLKCPRCQSAFLDYDGCNALTCAVPDCRAAFCAICLKDCGSDAHQHVRGSHKDGLFDKKAFHEGVETRTQKQLDILMNKLTNEPFELRQLVLNHVQKANLLQDKTDTSNNASTKTAAFL
jgi:hypothetical protein